MATILEQPTIRYTLDDLEKLIANDERRGDGGTAMSIGEAAYLVEEHFGKQGLEFPAYSALRIARTAQATIAKSQMLLFSEPDCWHTERHPSGEPMLRNGGMDLRYSMNVSDPRITVPYDVRAIEMIAGWRRHDKARLVTADQDGSLWMSVYGGRVKVPETDLSMEALYHASDDPGTGTIHSYLTATGGRHVVGYLSAENREVLRVHIPTPGGAVIAAITEP